MFSSSSATVCCTILTALCLTFVHSHALPNLRVRRLEEGYNNEGDLRLEPTETIVYPGSNVTFTCSHPSNVTFRWTLNSDIKLYDVQLGISVTEESGKVAFYSRLTIPLVTRRMSGEVICTTDDDLYGVRGFLIVNGVRNGGACRATSDCMTDKAVCIDGFCECPRNYVRLTVKDRSFDACREMIYSLYDPCEFDEQCTHLVDPLSVCKKVCVCAPWAKDRRGRCFALSELNSNRSQEMYRVGLIAVTCIIILIVAVSLWVTLKRSCHEQNLDGQRRSITQNDVSSGNRISIDLSSDKPPSYDDVLVNEDQVTSPPNFKDALKNCMSAKRLMRQVSAPAGQLLPQPVVETPKGEKPFHEA
ncbi:uncharacterized protein LOC129963517 isoform X2 [Argiope bruennichi]|uniref:Immunoglobulin domain-containing protein n=1 Tax=Argiope bruennichi TaxID=94029 RepID=A0A8T0F0Z5_ARGBR|nr:uncharacterized protein LOC129963517 isoform X2 [Argiope bruennichi]KAF8782578.1 hypothetical protein HNY73_012844 [Argiope bruennichi]